MESHVDNARNTMFREACTAVKGQLDMMCTGVEQWMTAFTQDLFAKLQRDYLATLVGGRAEATAALPLIERDLYEQVRLLLEGADSRFAQFSFPLNSEVPAAAVGSVSEHKDEDLIARQLEVESEPDTKPVIKPEPM